MTGKKEKWIEAERAAHEETPELVYICPISAQLMEEKKRQAAMRVHYMMLVLQDKNSV